MHSGAVPSASALSKRWRLQLLCSAALALSAAASSPPYGASPWLWYGSPAAPPAATVLSATGNARFTVLTPSLLRLERRGPGQAFVDAQSLAFWNRATPVPPFTASTTGAVTTIDTGLLLLTYTDDGAPFSDASLSVLRRAPAAFWANASATWRPSQQASVDAGNLLGTFHTLDSGHNGYGGGLNCSLLAPDALGLDTVDFYPCDFGVISKSGFVLVDDSRTPVWDAGSGWLASRPGAQCAAAASAQACFPGGQDTSSSALCQAAGCCWDPSSVQEIQLFYSRARQDHFTDNLKCGACAGLDYVLLHSQGYVYTAPAAGRVPLFLYWNPSPSPLLRGATGDNVASSFPPAQPGYTQERVEGYVGDPALPQPPNTTLLKLFYSAAHLDHWTTSGAADEAAAAAAGYELVGAVGYAPTAGSGSNSSALRCTAPAGPAYSSDAYLFAHGANYSAAIADYVLVAGPVPIPRRHWLGVSWSTWDESNDAAGTQAQVAALQAGGWPVDTYIFDMQWHLRPGWGGYQWDQARYGDAGNVSALLAHLHSLGLATGMNLHDADGVSAAENPQRWGAFASAMGLAPSAAAAPFDIANSTYASALQDVLLAPLLAQGLDLCWTDFQQGVPGVDAVRGLVPTALLNHYRFYTCAPRAGMRGTLHSRYAGRGDHRHTSSFGGDVNESWESLRFMVDFTKTAANAPLCWWGHEMMRQGGGINDNSELFARTNQFGAWSPIFTSWGNGGENNIWWDMPEPFASAVRLALVERLQLLPYRYTAAAASAATGLCSHRGMHFAFPLEPDAYATPGQYMLGEALIVAPALAPVAGPPIPAAGGAGPFGAAGVAVWVPPGDWRDFRAPAAPPLAQGWMTYAADIYTVPVLVRGGAAIPLLQLPANASGAAAAPLGASARQYSALTWRVFPGAASGAGEVYEDDGESTGYLTGASARTLLTYAAPPPPAATSLTIATTGAGYAGMVTQGRAYAVELLATSAAPARVVQNGVELAQGSSGAPGTWQRTAEGATVVRLFLCSTDAAQSVQLLYAE